MSMRYSYILEQLPDNTYQVRYTSPPNSGGAANKNAGAGSKISNIRQDLSFSEFY